MVVVGALAGIIGFWTEQPVLFGVGIGVVFAPLYTAGPGYRLLVRSIWRRSPRLRMPVEVHVDPDIGLTTILPDSTGQFRWSFWTGFLETERSFVLHSGRRKGTPFLVLAKRGLSSAEEISRLRDILTQKTGGPMPKAWTRTRD